MVTENKVSKHPKRSCSNSSYKKRNFARFSVLILLSVGMVTYSLFLRWQKNEEYNQALEWFNDGLYEDARESFESFGNYEDSFTYLSVYRLY